MQAPGVAPEGSDRLLPIGEFSETQQAISELHRWGVDVEALRADGATDQALVQLHDNLALLANKYGKNLEEGVASL